MKPCRCKLCGEPFIQAHPLNHICRECEQSIDDKLHDKIAVRHLPRDGIINDRGLSAEFRFINGHPSRSPVSYVETAGGPMWVHDEFLTYDPPRDLSPEASALVAAMKPLKEKLS